MTDLSHQEAAVLGILYEHHHYAYRIQEIMEKRGMDNWADIEFSSIHNILEQLETIKLVQSNIKAENGGQTSRKVYYITNEGKLVLKKKIKTIL